MPPSSGRGPVTWWIVCNVSRLFLCYVTRADSLIQSPKSSKWFIVSISLVVRVLLTYILSMTSKSFSKKTVSSLLMRRQSQIKSPTWLHDCAMEVIVLLHGFPYSAQCKWRNGENNRTLTLTLFLTLNLNLKLTVKALRHWHCAEYLQIALLHRIRKFKIYFIKRTSTNIV